MSCTFVHIYSNQGLILRCEKNILSPYRFSQYLQKFPQSNVATVNTVAIVGVVVNRVIT